MSLRSEIVRIVNELLAGSKKISELDEVVSATNDDLIEIVQAGVNVKIKKSNLVTGGGGGGSWGSITGTITDQTDLVTYVSNNAVYPGGDSMTGNLAMGGNKVTGLGAATTNGDAVRYEQLTPVVQAYADSIANSAKFLTAQYMQQNYI